MSDNPLYTELDRLRTVLAANKRLLPNEKLVVGNRPRGCLECGAFTHFEWYGIAFCSLDCLALGIRQKLNAIKTPTTTPAEQMWAYTEGKLDELIEQVRELEGQLAETQASCTAMKEALEAWQKAEGLEIELGQCGRTDRAYHEAQQQRDMALATDTGKAMLERMAKQEKALRAWQAWCLDERHSVADDTQLFEAAIELMDDALAIKEAQDAGTD